MRVIVTGSTGMVGKAILLECLESDKVDEILVINRRSLDLEHDKLKEVLVKDFFSLDGIDFAKYDACFHAMGVSSVGMREEEYNNLTFRTTKNLVNKVYSANSNAVFNYVSGQGTDSSELGKTMWARVKGKTENMIFATGFKDAYAFRIGGLIPQKGVKSKTGWVNFLYTVLKPLMFLLKKPMSLVGSSNIGQAMINVVINPIETKILNNREIQKLSQK